MAYEPLQDTGYMKALSVMVGVGPYMKMYYMCRAKTGDWDETQTRQARCGFPI